MIIEFVLVCRLVFSCKDLANEKKIITFAWMFSRVQPNFLQS